MARQLYQLILQTTLLNVSTSSTLLTTAFTSSSSCHSLPSHSLSSKLPCEPQKQHWSNNRDYGKSSHDKSRTSLSVLATTYEGSPLYSTWSTKIRVNSRNMTGKVVRSDAFSRLSNP